MRRVALLALALAVDAAAHQGEPLAPHDLWTAWEFDPGIVLPLAATAFLFLRASGLPARRKTAFWAGWLALVLALVSPLHPLGESLFSAHMVQHEILMAVAAPLLVLSRPLSPLLRGLPPGWRRAFGRVSVLSCTNSRFVGSFRRTRSRAGPRPAAASQAAFCGAESPAQPERLPHTVFRPGPANCACFCTLVSAMRVARAVWRFAADPFAAFAMHGMAIWLWHVPALFQATLTSPLVHAAQHASFLFSALLFWWALLHGSQGHGAAVLYVFATAVHTALLGALLTFAPAVWYPAYSGTTTAWGMTPLEDQQLGGLVMWVPAGILYTAAGLWLFALWLRASDVRLEKSALAVCVLFAVGALVGCRGAQAVAPGDPVKGKYAIEYYGCGSCHTIPGVRSARGLVGPPLSGIALRMYIGGVLENTPENMARWIQNPRAVDEKTAMPYLGVKPDDARNITSYLYTLR